MIVSAIPSVRSYRNSLLMLCQPLEYGFVASGVSLRNGSGLADRSGKLLFVIVGTL
jgi:hypothetical protein